MRVDGWTRIIMVILTVWMFGGSTHAQTDKKWEKVANAGQFQHVWISKDQESNRAKYDEIIAALCKPGVWCGINFWSERKVIPMRFPMSDAQVAAQVASYVYNPNTKYRQFMLNCRINPNPKECFS